MKLINFFLVKKAYYVWRQDFFEIFFGTLLFMVRYLRSRNRNCNLSKVNGTVTCQKSEPEPQKVVTVPQHCLTAVDVIFLYIRNSFESESTICPPIRFRTLPKTPVVSKISFESNSYYKKLPIRYGLPVLRNFCHWLLLLPFPNLTIRYLYNYYGENSCCLFLIIFFLQACRSLPRFPRRNTCWRRMRRGPWSSPSPTTIPSSRILSSKYKSSIYCFLQDVFLSFEVTSRSTVVRCLVDFWKMFGLIFDRCLGFIFVKFVQELWFRGVDLSSSCFEEWFDLIYGDLKPKGFIVQRFSLTEIFRWVRYRTRALFV